MLFGWPISTDTSSDPVVQYLGFNECPTHPSMGISQWGECYANGRSGLGNLIKWSELPEHLQQHVIARANSPDRIQVGRLAKLEGAHKTGRDMWGFEPLDGIGYFDTAFLTKKEARAHAKATGIILVETAREKPNHGTNQSPA